MEYLLLLTVLYKEPFGGVASPGRELPRPVKIGSFASMDECQAAARNAQFVAAGKVKTVRDGAEFLCVRSK